MILSELISLELEIHAVLLQLSSPVQLNNETQETVLSLQSSTMAAVSSAAVSSAADLKEISKIADMKAKSIMEQVCHINDSYEVLNSVLEQLNASTEQTEATNDTTVTIKVSQDY